MLFTDTRFIENYLSFGVLHRGRLSMLLATAFDRLPDRDHVTRGTIAAEIVQTWLNEFEDVVLWLQALQDWNPGSNSLRELLDRSAFNRRPDVAYRDKMARDPAKLRGLYDRLAKLALIDRGSTGGQFAWRFGLPFADGPGWGSIVGQDRDWFRNELESLARISSLFFRPVNEYQRAGNFRLWEAWNKTKHGFSVTLSQVDGHPSREWSILIHPDPADLANAFEIVVADREIYKFVATTMLGGVFLGRLLSALCAIRCTVLIDPPWLARARQLDWHPISRASLQSLLESEQVPDHQLYRDLRPRLRADRFGVSSPQPLWPSVAIDPDWWAGVAQTTP